MKNRSLFCRLTAAALALLMLASFPACVNKPDDPSESGSDTPSQQVTDVPTDSVTDTQGDEIEPADPDEADAVLTPDNAVVVTSPYAAGWEKTAAEELAAELGLTVVSDTEIPEGKSRLAIGYTAMNEAFGADFDAWGDLGYAVTAVDGDVLVAANSQTGMAAALSAFRGALTAEKTLPAATDMVVKASSDSEVKPLYQGDWGDNVAHAANLANTVGTHYGDIRRTLWTVYNKHVILHYDMKKEHCLTSIENEYGIPYAFNTGEVYVADAQGKRYYTTSSKVQGRTNTYQMGFYYSSAHILDEGFGMRTSETGIHNLSVDRTFHLYADKVNLVQHLTTTGGEATGISGYGQIYRLSSPSSSRTEAAPTRLLTEWTSPPASTWASTWSGRGSSASSCFPTRTMRAD